jgi:hypothetical protein
MPSAVDATGYRDYKDIGWSNQLGSYEGLHLLRV